MMLQAEIIAYSDKVYNELLCIMKNNYSLLEASKHLKKDAFAKLVQTELSKEKSYL